MRRIIIVSMVMLVLILAIPSAYAAGTAAGAKITNQASAAYSVGVSSYTTQSNVDTVTVDEIINVTVTWQDATNVPVSPGDIDRVTTFRVTNIGNGEEPFSLGVISTLPTGDNFDPTLRFIFIEDDGVPGYSAGDVQYTVGSSPDQVLSADGFIGVYILNNIPTLLINDNDTGDTQLTATSATTGSGASAGQVFVAAGTDGSDAVAGVSTGEVAMRGTYEVTTIVVDIVKSSAIVNHATFGIQPVPGATVTYTLVISATGSGTAQGVVVTDTIPTNTSYVDDTLFLNGVGNLSDLSDGDQGSVTDTDFDSIKDLVTVNLADMTELGGTHTITFQVTIN